jgi:hypothetical protein
MEQVTAVHMTANNVYFGDDASAGDAFDPTLNLFQWDAYSSYP